MHRSPRWPSRLAREQKGSSLGLAPLGVLDSRYDESWKPQGEAVRMLVRETSGTEKKKDNSQGRTSRVSTGASNLNWDSIASIIQRIHK